MTQRPIYFDYAATTPVDTKVLEAMVPTLSQTGQFGNAGSRSHWYGWQAEELIEEARGAVAALFNADPREIVFTSGATEANNLALKGVAQFYKEKGNHIITSVAEHKSVLDVCKYLESSGFSVTYLPVNAYGAVSIDDLRQAIRDETILVSLMWVNNEVGALNPIEEAASYLRQRSIFFHVDATQAAGKLPIDLKQIEVDLLSCSAHKIYGPKGVGALYVRRSPRVRLAPQMHGGGQERGLRSGTAAVPLIVGFGAAASLMRNDGLKESERLFRLKERVWEGLSRQLEAIQLNGRLKPASPSILNISFLGVEGESLMMALNDFALSSGSACTSTSLEPSYVLRAMGRDDALAHSSLRISMGRWTTKQEVDKLIERTVTEVTLLRGRSPLWEMYKEGMDLSQIEWENL